MSERRVKAWAVVDANGEPFEFEGGSLSVYATDAVAECEFEKINRGNGERVVPVVIEYQEEK